MKKVILAILALIIIVGLCGAFYVLGNVHAVQNMSIKRATPDQIATAMQQDNFYGEFRQNTLIVKGRVTAITKINGTTELTFKTTTPYRAYCQLAAGQKAPGVGSTITALAEGGPAQRQPSAVLLVGCVIL